MSEKIIKKLLQCNDSSLNPTHFDLLLDVQNAENVAKSICKILSVTSKSNTHGNQQIKSKLRESVLKLTQNLCSNSANSILQSQRTDIIIEHLTQDTNKERLSKARKKNEILRHNLNLHGSSEMDCLNHCEYSLIDKEVKYLNIGPALIHLNTEVSRKALNNLVDSCLNIPSNQYNDKTYEFLSKVWNNSNLIVSEDLYARLTLHVKSFLESTFLTLFTNMISDNENNVFVSEDLIELSIKNHFPNYDVLMIVSSKYPSVFKCLFYLLNDIFIRSNFDPVIHKSIMYILHEVRSRSLHESLQYLYPSSLKEIVLYLELNQDVVSNENVPQISEKILYMLNEMKLSNKFEYVLILSHYEYVFKLLS